MADELREVTLIACIPCLTGAGGECHTPGCAFWMSTAPDVPLTQCDGDGLTDSEEEP